MDVQSPFQWANVSQWKQFRAKATTADTEVMPSVLFLEVSATFPVILGQRLGIDIGAYLISNFEERRLTWPFLFD